MFAGLPGFNYLLQAREHRITFILSSDLAVVQATDPANTRHPPNVGTMLGQSRRRWANIVPTLGGCLVFAGDPVVDVPSDQVHIQSKKPEKKTNQLTCTQN